MALQDVFAGLLENSAPVWNVARKEYLRATLPPAGGGARLGILPDLVTQKHH